jgi:hypothetical protein
MSELPGDIQVARVKAIADELFVNAQVVGDDGPRISRDGVDCDAIIQIHLPWVTETGESRRQTLAMQLETALDTDTDELTAQLREAGRHAEEHCGTKFLRALS